MPNLDKLFAYIDDPKQQQHYIQTLRDAVAIPSVSADPSHLADCVRMADWLAAHLTRLGATVKQASLGTRTIQGREVPVPPAILASLGDDKEKSTVCIYGHYDVQPAKKEDGWLHPPFELHEDENHRLFGRGSTDDKGPVLAWLFAVEAFQAHNVPLPVNIKFLFEGTEESGSFGLASLIAREAKGFFASVDCVCISDSYWLGTERPSLQYGLRGIVTFQVAITGAPFDVHSGIFGGAVHEPMILLTHLLSRLTDPHGHILIPGVMDDVRRVSEEEKAMYDSLPYSVADFQGTMGGGTNTAHSTYSELLQASTLCPSLSIHGVEGAYSGENIKTVIPGKVLGKFSIRLVPHQKAGHVEQCVKKYLMEEFDKLKSKCVMKIDALGSAPAWEADYSHYNYMAGREAMEKVYGCSPELVRAGGSIPPTIALSDTLGVNVLLLALGAANDGAHSVNEKIDRRNLVQGVKVMVTYLNAIAHRAKKQ